MDTSIEHPDPGNGTYEPEGWDYVHDAFTVIYNTVGIICNILLISIIVGNKQMRSKTNLIILNTSLNNLAFLLTNMTFIYAFFELVGLSPETWTFSCIFNILNASFQFNEVLFTMVLLSNNLMRNIQSILKWLLIGVYTFFIVNYFVHQVMCSMVNRSFPFLYYLSGLVFFTVVLMVIGKEFNSCYKKCYVKDPLSDETRFRFNIGRIFVACWICSLIFEVVYFPQIRYIDWFLAPQGFISSLYTLIYVTCVDENFKHGLKKIFKCKRGENNYDAANTFDPEMNENQDNK